MGHVREWPLEKREKGIKWEIMKIVIVCLAAVRGSDRLYTRALELQNACSPDDCNLSAPKQACNDQLVVVRPFTQVP